MKLTDFEALSFDCYGTLIDWESGIAAYLARVQSLGTGETDVATLLETYGEMEAEVESESPTMLYPDVLATALRRTAAHHDIPVPDSLVEAFGHSVPDWPAFPDSEAALTTLQRHFKLIILSNIDRESFAASNKRLGITFDAILTAQDIGSYKPSPRNFDALLAHIDSMGIERSNLLHVAQSLFHDHAPAKAIGLPTVWINRRFNKDGAGATPDPGLDVQPDWTFTSMHEFAEAVDAET